MTTPQLKKSCCSSRLVVLVLVFLSCCLYTQGLDPKYLNLVQQLKKLALDENAPLRMDTFNRLTEYTDTFGPRLFGSQSLENSLTWLAKSMQEDNFENVRKEPVQGTAWFRGKVEQLELITPYRRRMLAVSTLGRSIGTPAEGIEAQIVVVSSFDDLYAKRDMVKGRIVVYNVPFVSYEVTAPYRRFGAVRAAKYGAVAALIRSVSPFSIYTVHTGCMTYTDSTQAKKKRTRFNAHEHLASIEKDELEFKDVPKIPAASITLEDASMLARMFERSMISNVTNHTETSEVRLRLTLHAPYEQDVVSYNVMGELVGSELPNEYIVIGGHLDSWDIGTGTLDDAGGFYISYQALNLLHKLKVRPRRTIRVVGFVGEEIGIYGALAYAQMHKNELNKTILALESDYGAYRPYGYEFQGGSFGMAYLKKLVPALLSSINVTEVVTSTDTGADIQPMHDDAKVPTMSPLTAQRDIYYWYHHSNADSAQSFWNPVDLDHNAVSIAALMYTIADAQEQFPRN